MASGKQAKSDKRTNSYAVASEEVARRFHLDLKNRRLAALLAWLFPGLGHLYQGRTGKGILFMLCILSTFLFGFYVGDGKVAYATPLTHKQVAINNPGANLLQRTLTVAIDRWPFIGQAGIGAVAIPAMVERSRFLANKAPLFPGEAFRPPGSAEDGPYEWTDPNGALVRQPDELGMWNYKLGFFFELGTFYTVIAGMLNVFAIYDAHSGPMVVEHEEELPKESNDKAASNE